MAYINPYEMYQPMMPQQPAPMANLPLYSGPEQAQWVPMGGGGQQNFQDAGAGMASLLRRFKRPGAAEDSHVGGAMGHGGTGGGIGPLGHGY
jgi:hypothetical protein